MAQLIKANYNALVWLQDELQQSLELALNAINQFIDGAGNTSLLDCSEALYQVSGTLEMLNLSGAAMLAQEMLQTVGAIRTGDIQSADQAQDALIRALLLLPNYLQLLGDDFQDHPITLLDSINELREVRNLAALPASSQFKPLLSIPLPASIAPSPQRKLPEIGIDSNRLSQAFQLMLLNWLRQQDDESLRKMRGIVHYLRLTCHEEKPVLLWWAAEGVLEALAHDGLPASAEAKQLLGKLLTPVKTQSEGGEAALLIAYPAGLLSELLLLVARATSHGPQVTLLKTVFDLHFFDHRPKVYGMSDNALGDAHHALYEQLQDLKQQLGQYEQQPDADSMDGIIQQLQGMSDTFALLAEYEASNLLHHQVELLQGFADQHQPADAPALKDLADSLLKIEALLDGASQSDVNEKLRSDVMRECLQELAYVKETLTLISQGSTSLAGSMAQGEPTRQLRLIAGSLQMLNLPEAAGIIEQSIDRLDRHAGAEQPLAPEQLNRLAEILSCCEIYMEDMAHHGQARDELIQRARQTLTAFDNAESPASAPQQDEALEIERDITETHETDRAMAEIDALLAGGGERDLIVESDEPLLLPAGTETGLVDSSVHQQDLPSPYDDTLPAADQWRFAGHVDAEIAAIFIEEARDVLGELDSLLPGWLSKDEDTALPDIRRHFHTLKGSGRMAGAAVIGELAWAVEQVLNRVLDGTLPQSDAVTGLVTRARAQLPLLLCSFVRAETGGNDEVDVLIDLAGSCLQGEVAGQDTPASPAPAIVPAFTSVDRYILEKQRRQAPPTRVENYLRRQQAPAAPARPAPGFTSVDRYILEKQRRQAPPTGVENYLRRQQPPAAPARPAPGFTSVDRYILEKQRRQAPPTRVENYLRRQQAAIVPPAGFTGELREEQELAEIFASEARAHIDALQQQAASLPQHPYVDEPMLRAIHSLKGAASIAGVTPMALVASELDKTLRQLHGQYQALDANRLALLEQVLAGLDGILHSLATPDAEPDIRHLSALITQLAPEQDEDSAPVIDPDVLVVMLEETDELLDAYGQQLAQWRQHPDDRQLQQELNSTLNKLRETASDARQPVIAELYGTLSALINTARPDAPGFDALLEQGHELLNSHIETLLQNKPVVADQGFDDAVHRLLQSISLPPSSPVDAIDETEFAIPHDSDPELLEAFTEEAQELLDSSGQAIKLWQGGQDQQAAVNQLQRDLHTLKGGARLAGISPMADLTHHTETLVRAVADMPLAAGEDFFDLLQRCQDKLTEMQEQLAARRAVTTAVSLIAEIAQLSGEQHPVTSTPHPDTVSPTAAAAPASPEAAPAHVEQVRVRADLLDYLTNFAGEVSISRDRVTQQHNAMRQQLHELEETVTRLHDQLRKLEIETETQILFRYEDEQIKHEDFDPLELDRFSTIQQLSRGLTESVTDLNDISRSMDMLVRETDAILLQQSRLNTDLQHGLMNTRLLPFSGIVPRLERIVRQAAAELDKKAQLKIVGAGLELDRTILDRIVAPLEHILRNAIAHGIETPEARLAAGKPETGVLELHVQREGAEILLTVSDDGQGIDTSRIRDKALAQGLIQPTDMTSDDQLIQLILTSGFSTADAISQLAGRGVGMDVVSNEISNLKGRLTIDSNRGQGTRFTIRLPLTLSVIQALLVGVGDEQYAVPLGSINAGERISTEDIRRLLAESRPRYVFNGEHYDFMPLAALLDKPFTLPDNSRQQLPLLLFRAGGMRIALLVDAIISNREVVIKSIGRQLGHIRALNGATILGDGRVVFILDIPTLVDSHDGQLHVDSTDAINLERELEHLQERLPIAMVVDDSITMRKASGNLLKRLGFEVMTARDGVDALSQLHGHKPDIILLDVEMPRMDGFEFASIVRNDPEFRHLPIIMITSRTGDKHRERAMAIGVNAYLGKPYQEQELVEQMQKLLGPGFFQPQ